MDLSIQTLSSANWNDFVSLMQTDSQCSECWCLNHRAPAGCATGLAAQEKMKRLTERNKVGGLLAYKDNECIGWIAIDPKGEYGIKGRRYCVLYNPEKTIAYVHLHVFEQGDTELEKHLKFRDHLRQSESNRRTRSRLNEANPILQSLSC